MIMKTVISVLAFALMGSGCRQSSSVTGGGFVLREGDLLFQDLDCGPLCDAIEEVTTGYHGRNFSHVGIVAKDDSGNSVVIEAVSGGVEVTSLQTFLNRSLDIRHRPKITVGRVKPVFRHLILAALEEASALKGKPYDKVFAIGNGAYYCSELIYEIFWLANDKRPVFTLQPMTFKSLSTGKTLLVWEEYFSELGVPLPQGQPGINPGAMSRSPVLTVVGQYNTPGQRP